jgi:Icc-related predicted phosphoesterase
MKFACTADLHGHLPILDHLDFDVLLIGGDITPHPAKNYVFQREWLATKFRRWLESVPQPVIAVAGNHDWIWQECPDMVPALPWTYLQDSGTTLPNGLRVWGSPHQPLFWDWAFNLEEPDLKQRWDLIPADTDILLLHGPPLGYGDLSPYGNVHTGSPSLTERIAEIRPKLCVYGHIHAGHGLYRLGDSILVNAAHVDEKYRPANRPVVVEVDVATEPED